MSVSHLINCVLISFAPILVSYHAKNLSDHRAFKVCLFAALCYLGTSFLKITIQAQLVGIIISTDDQQYSILNLIIKNIFNIIDCLGIYFCLKNQWSFLRSSYIVRILALSIGWTIAEVTFQHFFYILSDVYNEEFNWKYIFMSLSCAFDFVNNICIFALITSIQKQENKNIKQLFTKFQTAISLIIIMMKLVVLPIYHGHLHYLENKEDIDLTAQYVASKFTFMLLCLGVGKMFGGI